METDEAGGLLAKRIKALERDLHNQSGSNERDRAEPKWVYGANDRTVHL